MEIHLIENFRGGEFVIEENSNRLAELGYTNASETIIIDHTLVDHSYRNRGIGKYLVEQAVEFARQKNVKVVSVCPFAKAVIENTPEFQDIVAN